MKSPAEPKLQFEYSWDCPEWIFEWDYATYSEDDPYKIVIPEWLFPSDYCGKGG
jgi:hypothetical protein